MKNTITTVLATLFAVQIMVGQAEIDRHTTNAHDGWISCAASNNPNSAHGSSHWIRYDFGQSYNLYDLTVWNINHPGHLNDGMKRVIIETSQNGSSWNLVDTIMVPRAPGSGFYPGFNGPDLGGIGARYLLLTAIDNHGGGCYGLSEIRVYTTDQVSTKLDIVMTPCENDGILTGINGGINQGGTYTGAGVIDNGDDTFDFDAGLVGPGNYVINYQYSGGTESVNVEVLPCGQGTCPRCPECGGYNQATINSTNIPTDTYHGDELTSMGQVIGSSRQVHFKGNSIELQPGFQVASSDYFIASINQCDVDLLTNSDFENGTNGWTYSQYAAATGTYATASGGFQGGDALRLEVTNADDATWKIQFAQNGLSLEAGKTYQLSFAAKADGGGDLELSAYLDVDPYTGYGRINPSVTSFWKMYNFTFTADTSVDSNVRITFQFGDSRETVYWIDKVRLTEISLTNN